MSNSIKIEPFMVSSNVDELTNIRKANKLILQQNNSNHFLDFRGDMDFYIQNKFSDHQNSSMPPIWLTVI